MERSEERGRRTFIDVRKKTTDKDDIYKLFRCKLTDFSKRLFVFFTLLVVSELQNVIWTSKYESSFFELLNSLQRTSQDSWVKRLNFHQVNSGRTWLYLNGYPKIRFLLDTWLSSKCCFIMNLRNYHVYWRKHQNIILCS